MPTTANPTLFQRLAQQTVVGELWAPIPDQPDWVRCVACGHCCKIPPHRPGICKVRFNAGGVLKVPHGYVAGLQVDPVEKKPFFHVLPGSKALSFGMLGCDLHCSYCQNWLTSQTLRDENASGYYRQISAEAIVDIALQHNAPILTSTYNEPLITSEWAVEIFKRAQPHGLKCTYVSNGNATEEVLDYIRPYVVAYKVDLKTFQDRQYRKLGGTLDAVLTTIQQLVEKQFWVEIVTLIVPNFNDSPEELRDIAQFLADLSPDIPWHVTAFHPDYKMTGPTRTPRETLLRAVATGEEAGLHFVYAGNLPGQVNHRENTYCPQCQTLLIERQGFYILQNRLGTDGNCPHCGTPIPGIWS